MKQEVPEQRIVSEEMWAAVRERMALLRKGLWEERWDRS